MILIGTDEAGYGPNLGPLVVSATVWSVPSKVDPAKLHEMLWQHGINIADSKKLYHSGGPLYPLEFGVWMARLSAETTSVTLEMGGADPCWQDDVFDKKNLVAGPARHQLEFYTKGFQRILEEFGVRLIQLRSHIIGATPFNQRLDACGSKGALLSEATLEIVQDILVNAPEYRLNVVVLCDKHGGRNRYLDVINRFFPDECFRTVEESRPLSVYRSKHLEFRFQAKGEAQLPVALASMLSKYLREISMRNFNAFWRSHLPNLKPTAGYPADAKRFKAAIAEVQARLDIPDDLIWRKK